MSADNKLRAFLKASEAPARDYVFAARLRERMARHRMLMRLRLMAASSLALGFVLFGLVEAAGLDLLTSASSFFVGLASTPALAIAGITLASAMLLPRFLPERLRGR